MQYIPDYYEQEPADFENFEEKWIKLHLNTHYKLQ